MPMVTAFSYMLNTMLNYLGYRVGALSYICGMSLQTWVFVYTAAVVFKFCSYHKIFLWYIFINDVFNVVDYYWKIPLSTYSILLLQNILIGITLFTVLVLYVKSRKKPVTEDN